MFTGLGKLKTTSSTVTLNIDETVAPKAQPQRRTPYHSRDKVKPAIEILEQDDVIEKVPESQPTPWVSPIVAVPKKDGGVRIIFRAQKFDITMLYSSKQPNTADERTKF